MRVHIYEDREQIINKLCREFNVTPTKLVNELLLHVEDTICRKEKAKEKDDLFRRFNR